MFAVGMKGSVGGVLMSSGNNVNYTILLLLECFKVDVMLGIGMKKVESPSTNKF